MILKAALFIGAAFFLLVLLIWGSRSEYVRIADIYIEGNKITSEKKIREVIQMNMAGTYAWFFPHDNIFLYPKRRIKRDVLNTFSRIYDAKVRFVDLTSIVVAVKERKIYALWCDDVLPKRERNLSVPCYFVDDSGFVFAEAPRFSMNVYFEFYGRLNAPFVNEAPAGAERGDLIGTSFLTPYEFGRVLMFKNLLESIDLETYKFFVREDGEYEIFLKGKSAMETAGGKIVFSPKQELEKILYDLKLAIDTKFPEGGSQDITQGLEYIDLRFSNKVLFKFTP
ncbi:MAG: hypothetical protein BMS9Abin13_555 [Patescibacteria group bacterium]|nr:MAG: hypothetical protein BMS9Abin13_555 [Patescibacteria group bacterium]